MLTESWVEGKSVEEKDAQPTERTAALWGLSSKIYSRIKWTSQGMDWGWGQGIKSTTHRRVEEFGYSWSIPLVEPLLNHRQHQRHLTWAKEKKNWTVVAQWSKVLFSDESKFCISFGNQGPRVWRKGGEAHRPSCLKSSVKFPQSHPFTKTFWSTSCFLLLTSFLKMLISFSSRIWLLPTLPKAPKVG